MSPAMPKDDDLPYIHQYRDRHGHVRRYVRIKGRQKIALKETPGTAAFKAEYSAAVAGARPVVLPEKVGTVANLIAGYRRTAAFRNLADSSKHVYNLVLDRFQDAHGHRLVHDLPRGKAESIISKIGEETPAMANLSRAVLRKLFDVAIKTDMRADNPFSHIDRYKGGTHHTWTDEEIAAYEKRWPLGTRERLAFALLAYTGQRVGDVAAMRRADMKNGVIRVVQQKTGTELFLPVHDELARAIKAGPHNINFLIGNAQGLAISRHTLSGIIRAGVKGAKLPTHCVAHGLRKALLRRLAENNATTKQIASVSGHKTLAEIERYTAKADQKRLSKTAMGLLTAPKNGGKSG